MFMKPATSGLNTGKVVDRASTPHLPAWLPCRRPHWEVRRIKDVVQIRNDKVDGRPPDLAYVGLENIESWTGRLLLDTQPEVVESIVCRFAVGDVLFGKLRPYLAKVAMPEFDGICSTELVVLQPRRGLDRRFLFYTLTSREFVRWINSLAYGTRMPRVSPEQLESAYIVLPPYKEQTAIADRLDSEVGALQRLMNRIDDCTRLVQELRAARVSAGIAGGLDP